jgi:hypothetical protein
MPLDYVDHAEVERRLDAQLGLAAKPKRKAFRLRGPFVTCEHVQISRCYRDGITDVTCLGCGFEYMEVEG